MTAEHVQWCIGQDARIRERMVFMVDNCNR
jgi:hypothetical protein